MQIHTLRACSLLAIPPPPQRVPPQGGFPTDLSELNLSGWAALVQDMVAGLQVLPPNLDHDMGLPGVALLQLLEASTGVGFCRYCCSWGHRCKCVGASQLVPPVSWSQVVEQTPGYEVTPSSGGMTTPSTSVAGMPGYVVPPLGITPPDFSSWSLPPPEAPLPWGLPTALQGLSHIERSIQVRATLERHTQARSGMLRHRIPGSSPTGSNTAHVSAMHSSDGTASSSATTCPASNSVPTGSTVQPPGKSTGRGVTINSPTDKTALLVVKVQRTMGDR